MRSVPPLSLRARVFAVLLLVVVGTNLAALFFYYGFRDEAAAVGAATQAAEQIIVIRRMLERAPTRQNQIELLQRLNSPVMRMTFNEQPLVRVSDRQLPSRIFLRVLRREFPRDAEIRADSLFDDRAFENLPFLESMDQVTDRDPHFPLGDVPQAAPENADAHDVPDDFSAGRARPREERDTGFFSSRAFHSLRSLGGTLPVADSAMFRVSVRPPNSTRCLPADGRPPPTTSTRTRSAAQRSRSWRRTGAAWRSRTRKRKAVCPPNAPSNKPQRRR